MKAKRGRGERVHRGGMHVRRIGWRSMGVSRGRRGRGGDCIVVVSMIVSYSVPAKVVAFGGDGDGEGLSGGGKGRGEPIGPF
ncbi:hypothetical protein T231_13525 [Tannerella sp. oral taxon BU063 isolate Cell 6/7/9]|uniref:Uncharacterized protein n=2 Tax=Tannerella serpentiformis TaxID=712710 RepID=W2CM20_9BACT|nr:hypothetical protein N425_06975 [Tannerella sp. oral taxon BU063 isolate Cell 2]ETK08284.1 hypothetical protein T231_13525 [Tannerella sp. oral taxon BU063 isolate Cell 6/7/9]